jgi:FkbM family methyltransferase
VIKQLANFVHDRLARGPGWLAQSYIALLSLVSRNLLPLSLTRRIHNSVCGYIYGRRWPTMNFGPRRARMGTRTEVAFIPHLSGFEGEVLFNRQFDYEAPVVRWLESNLTATYRQVIEIGANVGIYTVFLDALYRQDKMTADAEPLPRIVSFEPSPKAYGRLLANLAANGTRFVHSYQAAIGTDAGLSAFYEPTDHLTNGSFLREFSEIFSKDVAEILVVTLAAPELEQWFTGQYPTLVKMDVEGYEPHLLVALKPLIDRFHPDLLIEVLDYTVEALNNSRVLTGYERHLITADGLQREPSFSANPSHRDWLLRWPRRVV